MGKPVVVAILGDNRGLRQSLDQSESRLSKFGSNARRAGKAAAIGLAGGAVVAGAALFKMAEAGAEDLKQQALLKNALKQTAHATDAQVKSTEKWIAVQGKTLGVTDDKLRPSLQTLAGATKDVGKAQKLATLAMNISARTGQDLEGVSKKLAKGYLGTVGGLKQYGVATKNADGTTRSFASIQDELSKKFAGSASTAANTFSGKVGRLKLQLDEAKESIGQKLLPVAEKLADWFVREGLPAIQRFGTWFKANLLPPLKELGTQVMTGLKGAFVQFKKALQDARPALELYGKYITKVLFPALKTGAKIIFPALGLAMRATGKALALIGTAGTVMWNKVLAPVFRFFANAVGNVLTALGKMFSALGHVPGMGWAKKAGRDLQTAARGAHDLADGIKEIPDRKSVKFSLVLSARDRAILENQGSPFVQGAIKAAPRISSSFTSPSSVAPRLSANTTAVASSTAPTIQIDQVVLQVPVGATAEDIGREFVQYISAYYDVGGTKL